MGIIALLLMCASPGGAWQVTIKNSCNKDVTIYVTGEHLFKKPVDCDVRVLSGKTGTCQLPGAICPFDIKGMYTVDNSTYDLNQVHCWNVADICCCWDVNVEVVQLHQNSCRLERR